MSAPGLLDFVIGDDTYTPSSGRALLYPKANGKWYRKDAAGVETLLEGLDTAATNALIAAGRASSIVDGDTTHSPDGNAVFDALALKADTSALTAKEDVANKATDLSVLNNTKYPTTQAVNNAITAAVAGLYDDRGVYNASGNVFPSTGGSGAAGAILKGDIWTVSVAGTLGGVAVTAGDLVRALQDTPGQTAGNWALTENNFGYVAENAANKSTDGTLAANSATLYPSQSAVKTYADTKVPATRTLAGTAPVRVDGGASADLSANRTISILDATASVRGSMSAADFATLANNRKMRVSALDFGADPTGVASSYPAIQAAEVFLAAGGILEFPAGTYQFGNVNRNLNVAHFHILGVGYPTVFITSSTTEPILTRNQWYQTIERVSFQGPGSGQNPTATAGALLSVNGANAKYGRIINCNFNYAFNCVDISDTLTTIDGGEFRYFEGSGIIKNENSDCKIEDVVMDNNTSFPNSGGGIDIKLCASLIMNGNNVIHANKALWVNPGVGVTVPSIKGVNNFFDNSNYGVCMDSGGSWLRSEFTNSWFSSMAVAGVAMIPAVGGQADGITFVNCDIYNNVGGTTTGVLTNAQTKKWKMVACSIAGWTIGVDLVAGAAHYATLTANTIGAVAAFGVNGTGVRIGTGAFLGIFLANNDCINNTTPITITPTPTFADYKQFRLIGNPGINVGGLQTPPAGTPVLATTYTNTFGYPIMLNVKHGATANTSVTINGVANTMALVAAQVVSYRLEPGDTWAVAGGTAPTVWVWNRQ